MNSLLYGVPNVHIRKLQLVQNAAARLLSGTSRYNHITPILEELHWLPICFRIEYKLVLFVFKALHGKAPQYISDLIKPQQNVRSLRSSSKGLLEIPKSRTVMAGDRAFQHAAPVLWNSLPTSVISCDNLDSFKMLLKTHLSKCAYNIDWTDWIFIYTQYFMMCDSFLCVFNCVNSSVKCPWTLYGSRRYINKIIIKIIIISWSCISTFLPSWNCGSLWSCYGYLKIISWGKNLARVYKEHFIKLEWANLWCTTRVCAGTTLLLYIYILPICSILRQHNIQYPIYADDTQLYCSFKLTVLQKP